MMIDREKVINCLNDIEQIMVTRQEICPQEELQYWIELQEGVADAIALLKEQEAVVPLTIDDAVSEIMDKHYKLLKEQEAVEPVFECEEPTLKLGQFHCGNCHTSFGISHHRFCPFCGKPVKWK